MPQVTGAKAAVRLSGPDCIYAPIVFTPVVSSNGHDLEIVELRIRRRDQRFTFSDLPLSHALSKQVLNDVIYWTYEIDDVERDGNPARIDKFTLRLSLSDDSDFAYIHLRAVEREELDGLLFFEVQDESEDWRPLEDTLLAEMIGESFIHSFEAAILDDLRTSDLSALPSILEDIT